VYALVRWFRDDTDTLPLLKERATNEEDRDLRSAVVYALARWFKNDPK
jgi:hypothetical protein